MTERHLMQVQVLERLGVPLITAAGGGVMATEGPQIAEKLAGLLGKSIQAALALGKAMDLPDADPQADSVKLALAAISAGLIAGYCRQTGKVPDDNETKRLTGALETILSYGDNFLPAAGRLKGIEQGAYPVDDNQISIQTINALVPVINAVAGFPFGRAERSLAQEISQRLGARATAMRKAMAPSVTEDGTAKLMELGLLRSLVALYVTCHEAGKMKLMAMSEAERAAAAQQNGGLLPMDPVWQAFESQAAMLEMLGSGVMQGAPAAAGNGDARAPVQQPPPAPPIQAQPASPPVPPPTAAAPPQPTGDEPHNPMAFFKPGAKKQSDTGQGQQG
ncbi:MAG TPA: hypothetical protein VL625_02345 [Patescibacteria group bacterium]|nr:hypothetical protein [Patescibacteria group bacterium]